MKFAIVTTSLNPGQYLSQTLHSVITQAGDFSIQYHVQDAGSTDGTVELLQSQLQEIERGNSAIQCRAISFSYASEPDEGMYDGINRGFRALKRHTPADVMMWINADDLLATDGLRKLAHYFNNYPEADWVTGRTLHLNEDGVKTIDLPPHRYHRQDLLVGRHDGVTLPFITQECTAWRLGLWKQCGELNTNLKYAGDYEYWMRAAKQGFDLNSLDMRIGYHRKRFGQLSTIGCYADEIHLLNMI